MAILEAAAGVGVGSTAANYWLQRDAAERNQQFYRENMTANYMISQRAQRNAARNEVEGLRAAGLSPALADGAASAPQVSAASGSMEAPQFDPATLLLRAQIQNLEAQTDKTNAEAANVRQQTGERETSGRTAALNLEQHFSWLSDNTTDKNLKAFYESMAVEAKESGQYGRGAQDSYQQFQQLKAESFEASERIIKSRLGALIAEQQFNKSLPHGEYLDKLSDLPQRQYDKLLTEIARLGADKKNLEALEAMYTSQKQLNEEQVKQVQAMAKKLEAYNLPELIKSGDSLGALAAFFGLLLEAIAGTPSNLSVTQVKK